MANLKLLYEAVYEGETDGTLFLRNTRAHSLKEYYDSVELYDEIIQEYCRGGTSKCTVAMTYDLIITPSGTYERDANDTYKLEDKIIAYYDPIRFPHMQYDVNSMLVDTSKTRVNVDLTKYEDNKKIITNWLIYPVGSQDNIQFSLIYNVKFNRITSTVKIYSDNTVPANQDALDIMADFVAHLLYYIYNI